jgi:glyoxylase-like metal-dependent hydrolase (beta-lactamase superfamily II)
MFDSRVKVSERASRIVQGRASRAGPDIEAERLASYDVLRLRAENAGPLTLSGTNTWIVDRNPAYIIDPGPAIGVHLDRMIAAVDVRGGLGGIVLTHDHLDHCEAVEALRERRPAPLAAGRGKVDVSLAGGVRFGPLEAIATPGHAPDHFSLLGDRVCFTGDAVLGEGSVFITPDRGALAGYLNGLARLSTLDIDVICPGHGPAVWEPYVKLEEYIGHRYDREHALIHAIGRGARTVPELLDGAWSDVPEQLRPLATATLAAHLDKLADEDLLPEGVEYPSF